MWAKPPDQIPPHEGAARVNIVRYRAVQPIPVSRDRQPKVCFGGRELELARHHADDCEGPVVNFDRLSDRPCVSSKPPQPEGVSDDCDGLRTPDFYVVERPP